MPAEVALHRRLGELALFQLDQRLREGLHIGGLIGPAQIAALFLGARILRRLGQFLELLALLQLVDDGLGFVLVLDQDVARLEFLFAQRLAQAVVFVLDHLVGDRVGLDVVVQIGADQHALARHHHLGHDVGLLFEALLFGFLHEDLAAHQFLAHGTAQLRRVRLALRQLGGQQGVDAGLGNGLAVDGDRRRGGGVLGGILGRLRGAGQGGEESDRGSGEQLTVNRAVHRLILYLSISGGVRSGRER